MAIEPTITSYATLDLLAWFDEGTLELSPKFQRRLVWKPAAKAYFIDTLLRAFPVPPIHVRIAHNKSKTRVVREVVDGQQRLKTLFDFIGDRFALASKSDAPWAGKTFSQLSESERDRLTLTKFHVYQYQGVDDKSILEIFSRINTYSVALNAQELRNGRYFGQFKQCAYSLGLEYLEFWRSAKLFTESGIARMQEAELASELLIMQLDGVQDKKTSVEEFYKNLDEDWSDDDLRWTVRGSLKPTRWLSREQSERRFRATMSEIYEAVGEVLAASEFSRVPLFYSLYGAVHHRLFSVPNFTSLPAKTSPLGAEERRNLRSAVEYLSSLLQDKDDAENLPGFRREFVLGSLRQTDNLNPRLRRLEGILKQARLI
jgi:hypothetical protein